jgi:hypothetical protein
MHGTFFQSIPEASPTLWPDRPMKYIAIQERRNSNSAAGRPAQPAKLHLSPKSCTPSQPSKQTARLTRLPLCSHLCRLPKSTPAPSTPSSADFKSASGEGEVAASAPAAAPILRRDCSRRGGRPWRPWRSYLSYPGRCARPRHYSPTTTPPTTPRHAAPPPSSTPSPSATS